MPTVKDVMLCYVMLCYVMLCYVMLCYVMFARTCRDRLLFCGHNILTETVFVTQLSSNVEISR